MFGARVSESAGLSKKGFGTGTALHASARHKSLCLRRDPDAPNEGPANEPGKVGVDRTTGFEANAAANVRCGVAGKPSAAYIQAGIPQDRRYEKLKERGRKCGSSGATPKRDSPRTRTSPSV